MDFERERERMVRDQLEARGIRDPRVLEAFRRVPRHRFVSQDLEERAYEDHPLSIGSEQTISQPYMVATMSEALQLSGGEKVLEIGTGSGYQSAILCALGVRLYSIERVELLAEAARHRIQALGYSYQGRISDGTLGWPEEAPFDRILVTAGAPDLPISLLKQMAEGGRMVIPVGEEKRQELYLVQKQDGRITKSRLCSCLFVRLVGQEGW
jgi:protein-L-isoaspartate(D-aspartate) O-methyltransferase